MKKILGLILINIFLISCNNTNINNNKEKINKNINKSSYWKTHVKEDILPFWDNKEALGEPIGNFPTYRINTGKVDDKRPREERYPRMIGRQIYLYNMAYHMTGEEKYLKYAKKGLNWLVLNGKDFSNFGWYSIIDKDGNMIENEKTSQNDAYCVMGPASDYYITRNLESEKLVLEMRNTLFDNTKYWNEQQGVINMLPISHERNHTDLVAHLDQLNAYMLMVQEILSKDMDKKQFLKDMKLISDIIIRDFKYKHYISRQYTTNKEDYLSHFDYGHIMKSYWIISEIGDRLKVNKYEELLKKDIPKIINEAYDKETGLWQDNVLWWKDKNYGSTWWVYAELDQGTMIFNNLYGEYDEILMKTLSNWKNYFVDKKYNEVYSKINRDYNVMNGSGIYSKQNYWKNGFHSIEHGLFGYLLGENKEGVSLYFAIPEDKADSFVAKPYIFEGDEVDRKILETIRIENQELKKVKVTFKNIR
ncbi:MAG: AGE family epimerase/isomerase [Fusobacteriota bacterium]